MHSYRWSTYGEKTEDMSSLLLVQMYEYTARTGVLKVP